MDFEIIHGEALEVMRGMADNSVDAVVTDPPYFKVKGEAALAAALFCVLSRAGFCLSVERGPW